ncbi:hypothetical protein ACTNDS_16535, partial [Blautia sp. HCP3S3_C12]
CVFYSVFNVTDEGKGLNLCLKIRFSDRLGGPAKVIKYRFNKETIDAMEESKWFDLEPEQIMEFYSFKDNPLEFAHCVIEKYRK